MVAVRAKVYFVNAKERRKERARLACSRDWTWNAIEAVGLKCEKKIKGRGGETQGQHNKC